MTLEEKRTFAWVGDAVLALFARRWILQQTNISSKERADVFQAMTSNEFLSHFGEPTQIECDIGILFENKGLTEANHYIETHLLPSFIKRRRQNKQPGRYNRKKSSK
jgi:23S rRNA maturation mini-RNase III